MLPTSLTKFFVAVSVVESYEGQAPFINAYHNLRFAKAYPEPTLIYFSKSNAFFLESNARYETNFQGAYFLVCNELC